MGHPGVRWVGIAPPPLRHVQLAQAASGVTSVGLNAVLLEHPALGTWTVARSHATVEFTAPATQTG